MNITSDWYQAAGLGILGWAALAYWAHVAIHQKVQSWFAWGCGIVGALLELAAGTYLANTSAVKAIVGFIQDWPLLAFIVFVVVIVGIAKLPVQALPDKYHTATITMSVAVFVLLLPSLLNFIPGQGGAKMTEIQTAVTRPIKEHTQDWFNPDWHKSRGGN